MGYFLQMTQDATGAYLALLSALAAVFAVRRSGRREASRIVVGKGRDRRLVHRRR